MLSASQDFYRREIRLTFLLLIVTLGITVVLVQSLIEAMITAWHTHTPSTAVSHIVFTAIVAYLMYGNFIYQLTRLGHLKRTARFTPTPLSFCLANLKKTAQPLTILIPSYKEESGVIEQTILSAALQEYPNTHVVLLIDDPVNPFSAKDKDTLKAARELPEKVHAYLEQPRSLIANALKALHTSGHKNEQHLLAQVYDQLAHWFFSTAKTYPTTTHTDELFVSRILTSRALHYQQLARDLLNQASRPRAKDVDQELRQLIQIFSPDVASFERKRYVNLSHEANKAMNLNSYISLMGKTIREHTTETGTYLQEVPAGTAHSKDIPDASYVITLDADSLLLPGYAAQLIHFMEQPSQERVAVVQTPYSAVPQAPNELEYTAGATTDIQYLIHQGFTRYHATFWVGANALIRKSALEDIATDITERGFPIVRYIQDRTVIEDTESSIDLVAKGWRLYNHPERLAYSATPPDFGALLIQRRHWANGGLIIAPKLLRYIFTRPFTLKKYAEGFVRFHYLTSIAGVNVGLLLLLLVPFQVPAGNIWFLLAALPYYVLYTRDLRFIGYRHRDIFRVYALNLMLLPINLGGVLKSLQQAWTGQKIPFGRTPKVQGRTAAPAIYIASLYFFWAYSLVAGISDVYHKLWIHAVFSLINAGFFTYIIVRFLGLKASYEDTLAKIPVLVRRSETP